MGGTGEAVYWHLYGNARYIHREHQSSYHCSLFWRSLEWRYRVGNYRIPRGYCGSVVDYRTPCGHDWPQTDMGCRTHYFHYWFSYLWCFILTWHVDCCLYITWSGWGFSSDRWFWFEFTS